MIHHSVALILSLAICDIASAESYRRVTDPKRESEFYRTGGHAYRGKRVHVHVDIAVLRQEPKEKKLRNGLSVLEFKNRSVPVVLKRIHRDYVRLKKRFEKPGTLCLYGRVIRAPGAPQRCALWVEKMRRLPPRRKSPSP